MFVKNRGSDGEEQGGHFGIVKIDASLNVEPSNGLERNG